MMRGEWRLKYFLTSSEQLSRFKAHGGKIWAENRKEGEHLFVLPCR